MLEPKRPKFRKQFRGKMRGLAQSGADLVFGEYGLKATDRGWLTAAQIEAARKAITHYTKRGGKIWIRVFPDKPASGKSAGVRMGGGKGDTQRYVAVVRPGRMIFELTGVSSEDAREAMALAAAKMPFKTVFIEKEKA
jgi:large subunit ribosomal protein L16